MIHDSGRIMTSPTLLKVTSFEQLYERVRQAQIALAEESHGDQVAPVEIWYRGVSQMRYQLLPSLLRFQNGLSSERQLYAQFVEHTAPTNRDWYALYEMQHFFIPTRLLDWTASFGVALHFSLNSDEPLDNPSIWLLNPAALNVRALAQGSAASVFKDGKPRPLQTDDLERIGLRYVEEYVERGQRMPRLPLAVTPEAVFPRLRAQRGRFTVQGEDPGPLESLCPGSVQRVVISNSAVEEISNRITLMGIDAFSIFPDSVGLADFLRRRHGLSRMTRAKTLASKIRALWRRDLDALKSASGQRSSPTPSISITGIENCAVAEAYLERREETGGVQSQLEGWVRRDQGGICVVTGDAGSGKTNCLLNLVASKKLYENHSVIWYPLFRFSPNEGLLQNLHRYLQSALEESISDLTIALSELLKRSDTILILDGLDELSRTKGRKSAIALSKAITQELQPEAAPDETPKVLISCRGDIYEGLREELDLSDALVMKPIEPLPSAAVKSILVAPLTDQILELLARYPLFLRFLHDNSLAASMPTSSSGLFEALMPERGLGRVENLKTLGRIAGRMLRSRQDFLEPEIFGNLSEESGIDQDFFFQPKPMQALLKEKNGEVRFLHHTLREFVLAWNIHHSLTSQVSADWDLLLETSDLDYEGAEVHRAIAELEPSPDWGSARNKWIDLQNRTHKDNFGWCCFEIAGMLGVEGSHRETILDWIYDALKRPLDGQDAEYSFHTKFNAIRCLARLHPSAPSCYWEWILDCRKDVERWKHGTGDSIAPTPDDRCRRPVEIICGYAVRGFQLSKREIKPGPFLMRGGGVRGGAVVDAHQDKFSKILIERMKFLISLSEISKRQAFVLVNMTYALIRWYSKAHREQVEELLGVTDLDHRVKANLRLTLWYWHPELRDREVLVESDRVVFVGASDRFSRAAFQ
jgi:hypothetical protein